MERKQSSKKRHPLILNNKITQSIIYAPNVQLGISNALLKSGKIYLFTLFEAGLNNMKGSGCIQTENIKLSVCLLIYLFHALTLLGLSSQEVQGGHLSLLGEDIS